MGGVPGITPISLNNKKSFSRAFSRKKMQNPVSFLTAATSRLGDKISLVISEEEGKVAEIMCKSRTDMQSIFLLAKGRLQGKKSSILLERYPELLTEHYAIIPRADNRQENVKEEEKDSLVLSAPPSVIINHQILRPNEENVPTEIVRFVEICPYHAFESFSFETWIYSSKHVVYILTIRLRMCDVLDNALLLSSVVSKLKEYTLLSPDTAVHRGASS